MRFCHLPHEEVDPQIPQEHSGNTADPPLAEDFLVEPFVGRVGFFSYFGVWFACFQGVMNVYYVKSMKNESTNPMRWCKEI